jgi:hypothetical protein
LTPTVVSAFRLAAIRRPDADLSIRLLGYAKFVNTVARIGGRK